MKVCILTTVHPAFDTRIFHKQAKSLVGAGYDVTLIAQHDKDEVVDGIKILALPKPRNRFLRMMGMWRVFKLAYAKNADAYHFHDPELLPIGLLLKFFTKGKVIYDVHEDYPNSILYKYWIPFHLRKAVSYIFNIIEKAIAYSLDLIIVVNNDMADKFRKGACITIWNYSILEIAESECEYNSCSPTLIYVGGLSEERGISEIVQAMDFLDTSRSVKLILCGEFGTQSYRRKVTGLWGYKKVEYLGYVEPENVPLQMARATIGIACLHPVRNYMYMPTTKVFQYVAAGLPVVVSNFPKWKEFIEGINCGIVVNPLDPQEIARAVGYLIEHPDEARRMGENGRKAVLEKYNWENESKNLLAIYEDLLRERKVRQ